MNNAPRQDAAPEHRTDDLSSRADRLIRGEAGAYEKLVITGPGNAAARAELEALTPAELLSVPVRSEADGRALLSGLWLWHDWLDESHTLSQAISSATGSFWHAILHRREGDFSNSKYWYARCAGHPIFPTLAVQASGLINDFPADKSLLKLTYAGWNPNAFVDLVEAIERTPGDPRRATAVALQRMEWRLLFEHTTRAAAGK